MKYYRAVRAVARRDERCTACGGVIPKNTCIAGLFIYRAHGKTPCEAEIEESYAKVMDKQRKHKVDA
ncbi:hypothetical protein SEA_TREAT_68 [Streptomyces phage Treat]|nr:hypothetical protein SEA_TREAT_68 [Streptomyces phage Treat]